MDIAAELRALRRTADLSQAELAQRAGLPQSAVSRIESGATPDPRFRTIERLVRAAGAVVAIQERSDSHGPAGRVGDPPAPASAVPHDGLRDAAGRRYPAHLDVRATYPMLGRDRRLLSAGTPVYTFKLDRDARDERRATEAPASDVRIERVDDMPEGSWSLAARAGDDAVVGQLTAWVWPHEVVAILPSADAALCHLSIDPGWRFIGIEQQLLRHLRQELAARDIREIVTFAYRGLEGAYLSELGFHPRLRGVIAFTLSSSAGTTAG